MILGEMQRCLTDFYGLELRYDVNDFLITDHVLAGVLGGAARPVEEELLISEKDGGAEVSLYLKQELVDRLQRNDPVAALNHSNLADFWTAFEGVSHFTYFVFNACRNQCVTLLELELQAEVDKFVATSLFLQRQGETIPVNLHRWLFDLPKLHEQLTPAEQERYTCANHYAAKYCLRLAGQLDDDRRTERARRELRHFYRLPRQEKIGHIDAAYVG
jgi:hypothetical protein